MAARSDQEHLTIKSHRLLSSRKAPSCAARDTLLGALVLLLGLGGCTPMPPPARPEPPAEVRCDVCGQPVAPKDAEPGISLDGTDVYTCQRCVAKARRRGARPAAGTSGKTSSGPET
jgi:hypothetical protein